MCNSPQLVITDDWIVVSSQPILDRDPVFYRYTIGSPSGAGSSGLRTSSVRTSLPVSSPGLADPTFPMTLAFTQHCPL